MSEGRTNIPPAITWIYPLRAISQVPSISIGDKQHLRKVVRARARARAW